MNRREFLKRASVAAGAVTLTACSPKQTQLIEQNDNSSDDDNVLRIIQQKHFISGYDEWFNNEFVKSWSEKNNIEVQVTHAGFADLFPIATGLVALQRGSDIFAFPSPPMAFENEVVDLGDIAMELEEKYGKMADLAKKSVENPITEKYVGISDHWVPMAANWRTDLWKNAAPGVIPGTWDDVLKVGKELKKLGNPIGVGMSTDLDSNIALNGLLNSFGANIQDAEGNITVNSPETAAALAFGAKLFKETMQSEVLAWNASSNNQFMLSGKGSFSLNAVSITRVAEKNDPELAEVLGIGAPPTGSTESKTPANVISVYSVWKFSKKIDIAKQFIKDLIENAATAFERAELYNYPSFPGAVPNMTAAYEAEPKYSFLKNAPDWSSNIGYPGSANAIANETLDKYLLPKAFSLVASGILSPDEGANWLFVEVSKIVEKWNTQHSIQNIS